MKQEIIYRYTISCPKPMVDSFVQTIIYLSFVPNPDKIKRPAGKMAEIIFTCTRDPSEFEGYVRKAFSQLDIAELSMTTVGETRWTK